MPASRRQRGIVYDLTDPTDPAAVGTFPSGHDLFITDRGYMYNALLGVKAYDLVPDPTAPEPIWDDGRDTGHDVAVFDDVPLDFHGYEGTTVYDAADPRAPDRLVAAYYAKGLVLFDVFRPE